jgi:glycosyltransferase involved in cell wall biosynthesis
MDRLKVLFITTWYPTAEEPVGGVFVREHAKAVELYDDIKVIHCAGPDQELSKLWRMQQEMDENLTKGIPSYRLYYRHFPIPKTWYLIHIWSVFQAFRKIVLQGFNPDIIHAHTYDAGVPAALIGKVYGIPVVVTEHTTAFPRKLVGGLGVFTARFAFESAEIVMPVSKSLQKAIEAYGIKAHFQIIPNVVDTNLFTPSPVPLAKNESKRLLFVGLLGPSHKKGIPHLLSALALLRERRDDWHLDVVGDGPLRAEYELMAGGLGLGDKVTVHGLKEKEEVAEFMRHADIFVLPSLFETFAVVAAEALATGLPVLATRCGGPEEFITDDVGLLVPPGNAKALYKGLDFILDNSSLSSRKQIHQYAKGLFSPEIVGATLHKAYQSLKSPN